MKHASKKKPINKARKPLAEHLSLRLREGLLILSSALALFLLLALFTYHRNDPGWSSTGFSNHIANAGGRAGAWFADVALYLCGYMAYVFPFMLAYSAWLFLRPVPGRLVFDVQVITLRTLGFILIFIGGTGLASLEMPGLQWHLPFTAGGILGNAVGAGLAYEFNLSGATLILLGLFCAGVTLFTGLSWLAVMDKLGEITLNAQAYIKQSVVTAITVLRTKWIARREKRAKAKLAQKTQPSPAKITPPQPEKQEPARKPEIKPAVAQINVSKRAVRERQPSLFQNMDTCLPSLALLDPPETHTKKGYSAVKLEEMSREVEVRLQDFGIEVQVVAVHPGPVITRFEMQLAAGVKVSRISALGKDLARSLSVISVRIVEVIPGKSVVGLELPNENREMVRLSEILASQQYEQARSPLALALGKDIAGHPVIVDLAKMPHLLVAGTTGSGKSVGVNAMLLGLLYKSTPKDVRMILVDPKMLELSIYEGIPHLLTPVVIDMKEAANALRWCVAEMERRYRLMAALGVRNLGGFNNKVTEAANKGTPLPDPLWQGQAQETCPSLETLPFIVVVIDEYADMMMVVGKKVEQLIARIAQKARAAGIHLILATQRPSVDVITGLIKANIPTRIAYQVSSKIDSRTVLDQAGAEQLLGHGDMLYLPPGTSVPVRVHGAFVADDEVHKVVNDWQQRADPEYIEAIIQGSSEAGGLNGLDDEASAEKDECYDQAVYIVTSTRKASISSIQRRLKIGYNRAARLVEEMEAAGIVSAMESNGSREVLAPPPPKAPE